MKRQKNVQGSSAKMLQVLQTRPISEEEITIMATLAEERDKQIDELEKGVTEINDLMVDVTNLLNQQAHTVGTIADHLDEAMNHTDKGVKELEQAAKYQQSWQCRIS